MRRNALTSPPMRAPGVRHQALDRDALAALALIALFAVAPPAAFSFNAPYWADVLNRVMVLGLAATSLNLLIGTAGVVSLGHAVFLGLGSYAVGIAAFHGIENGFVHLGLALAVSALFALVTGLVALRTRGAHFIMITLAFAQMVYFVMIGLKYYGGDDGLTLDHRSVFPDPLDFDNRLVFYYLTLACLALVMFGFAKLRRSRFGLVLIAAKGNERRVAAVGLDPYRYRLAAYVIAGTVCGLAGFLNANLTSYVTPDAISWTRSGELLFMVILGGVGTVAGPLVGAAVFLVAEELLGSLTVYWQFWFGLLLVAVVLFGRGGLIGLLISRATR